MTVIETKSAKDAAWERFFNLLWASSPVTRTQAQQNEIEIARLRAQTAGMLHDIEKMKERV